MLASDAAIHVVQLNLKQIYFILHTDAVYQSVSPRIKFPPKPSSFCRAFGALHSRHSRSFLPLRFSFSPLGLTGSSAGSTHNSPPGGAPLIFFVYGFIEQQVRSTATKRELEIVIIDTYNYHVVIPFNLK